MRVSPTGGSSEDRDDLRGRVALRTSVFLTGLMVALLAWIARDAMERDAFAGFLVGALTLGGGFLICGAFSFPMYWHGVIGAGVLALLGAARGMGNVPDLVSFLAGERERGAAPVVEAGVTALCLVLLARVLTAIGRERWRRMMAGK
jgi:hypothetical protein